MSTAASAIPPPALTARPATLQRVLPRVAMAAVVLWLVYNVNGLRPPWAPIVVDDADSGAGKRQLLFTSAGLLAFVGLFLARRLGRAIAGHVGVAALAGGLIATALYSPDRVLTIKRAIIFELGLLTLLSVVHLVPRPVLTMQRVVGGVTAVAAWLSVVGWFVLPRSAVSIAERPGLAGVSGHPNTLGPAMVVGFMVLLGMRTQSAAVRLGQVGLVIALYLSNSITSIVMLLEALLLFAVMMSTRYRRGVLQIIGVTVVVVVAIIGPSTIKQTAFSVAGRDPSLSGRSELWGAVLHEGMKNPMFGRGYGAFWYEGRGREIVGTWNPRQSHNAYLDLFVDLGAVGLLCMVALFAGTILGGWRRLGSGGSGQARAVASMTAISISLMTLYAWGESYFLKLDKLPMFCLLWFVLLIGNRDETRIEAELGAATGAADRAG